MKILYVAPNRTGGTSFQRKKALQAMGHDLVVISTKLPFESVQRRWLRVFSSFMLRPFHSAKINWQIRNRLKTQRFNVLWIDKGLVITPRTLAFAKITQLSIKLVSYSPDDMMNPANQSKNYLEGIPLFDYHVTTKSYNVDELKNLGAKEVVFVGNAYDPEVHRPVKLDTSDPDVTFADVGFIGAYEEERTTFMDRLAKDGVDVVFHCPVWPMGVQRPENLRIVEGFLANDDYAKQICAFKINLAFLRKINRDLQTTRSIEIPACGAFMLAERTLEHLDLFTEDVEAVFFSDYDELYQKVKLYLKDDSLRNKIADAGLQRVRSSDYSNRGRLSWVIEQISSPSEFQRKAASPSR